jgi:hypothetical protein
MLAGHASVSLSTPVGTPLATRPSWIEDARDGSEDRLREDGRRCPHRLSGVRVAGLAQPSEVLVSHTVKDLVAGSGLEFEDTGEPELKGIPERWRLLRVVDAM